MNIKTSKILSIVSAIVIFLAFFMPWTKSMFGLSVSAWDMVEQLFTILSKANSLPEDIRAYLPFLLIALPICSAIIIITNSQTLNDSNDTTNGAKVVTIIVVVLVMVTLIYVQANNPFSDLINIVDILGLGFYLTLIGAGYYLVDLLTEKTKTPQTYKATTQTEFFCTNCGKQYQGCRDRAKAPLPWVGVTESTAEQFCEECGSKL